jgi:3',5'-cyclic AMP phosphodiesterase CpdA
VAPRYAVAQISDFHVVEAGRLLADAIDTADYTRRAVSHLNGLDPQPDVILATGDLVDGGTLAEYEHLRALLAPLRAPLWLLPGNHDDRVALRTVFGDHDELGDGPYVQFVIEGAVRVIGLDSSRAPEPGGRLDPQQLAWLDEQLDATPVDAPVIVALHHPPFATGIGHMDAMGLAADDADALGEIVAAHPNVERVQAGHLHRTIERRWHGTIAATAPSVAHAVALDLRADGLAAWNREPPAYQLHYWTPALGLVTHVEAIGGFDGALYA